MNTEQTPHYDLKQFPFMRPQGPTMPWTESSVCIPPALWLRDSEDALWTLGFDYSESEWRSGKYTPSPKVLSQMLYRVYPWALRKAGLHASEAQLDTIEELLWKVKVTDGERNIELL